MSRMEFFEMTVSYDGEGEFPYDALDLAFYLKFLIDEQLNASNEA